MAGHSQFKNIMHRKGRQDAVKSKLFSKLAREITVAAKMGTPDPAMNPRLRLAVQAAKAESMPKDNIQRAINKAAGGDTESYEEVRYEGYGPGGVALIVEALARLDKGSLDFVAQRAEGVTYARKIDKSETHVDWNRPSHEVHNHIRGLSPFPGAWCEGEIGGRKERLKLLRSALATGAGEPGSILDDRLTVACAAGAVRLVELQRAGGKAVSASEFLHGTRMQKGTKLS